MCRRALLTCLAVVVAVAAVPFSQRYMLGPQLGVGGHSEVHEARHLYRSPNRVFAVKHVQKKLENEFQVEMLRREATIIRSLDHNYILKVFEYVEDDGNCYLVTPKMGVSRRISNLSCVGHRVPMC